MYKALITDLDGTAVGISSDGSDVDQATKDAVQFAIEQGKHVTCATGREWDLAKSVVKTLGIISPYTGRQELKAVKSVPHSLRFLYLLAVPQDIAIKISNQINAQQYAVAHFTPSWKGGGLVDIHVTNAKATKEYAIHV